jgi:hypothetical protein
MRSPSSWTPAARPCAEMPVPRLWIRSGMRTREAIEAVRRPAPTPWASATKLPRNLTVNLRRCSIARAGRGDRVAVFLRPSQDLSTGSWRIQPDWVQADAGTLQRCACRLDSACCRSFAADRRGPRCCQRCHSRAHAAVRVSRRTGRKRRASRLTEVASPAVRCGQCRRRCAKRAAVRRGCGPASSPAGASRMS